MWIATKIGFFSIVEKEHHENPNGQKLFVVRARDSGDLHRLILLIKNKIKKEPTIYSYEKSDYPHRIYLETKEDFEATLAVLTQTVTYPNFKDEILETDHQKDKVQPYSDLWLGLLLSHNKGEFGGIF